MALFGLMMMAVAVSGRSLLQEESDVPCSTAVTYSVLNDCDWNAEKFPTDFPTGSDHWSPLCGTAHNSDYTMWEVNGTSTEGVKDVAELGSHTALNAEIDTCVDDGNCAEFVTFSCKPFSGTCKHEGTIDMTEEFPYVSLLSMIAPSPDWMTGVNSVKLCGDEGMWLKSYSKDLIAYDAGTDDGESYESPDSESSEPITAFDAEDETNIFYNVDETMLYPVCTITFTLEDGE